MRTLVLALVLLATACTRYVAVPQTAAPAPAAKPTPNLAESIAKSVVLGLDASMQCTPWTGRGTPYGGDDAVMCVSKTQVIYVSAPANGEPKIKLVADFTPQPAAPPSSLVLEAKPAEPTKKPKTEAKKK